MLSNFTFASHLVWTSWIRTRACLTLVFVMALKPVLWTSSTQRGILNPRSSRNNLAPFLSIYKAASGSGWLQTEASVCSLGRGGRRCTSRHASSGCSSCCCCQTHVFSPTASLTLMKNKLCFALQGQRVEDSELSNLRRCMAFLQQEPETQQTKLFAATVFEEGESS